MKKSFAFIFFIFLLNLNGFSQELQIKAAAVKSDLVVTQKDIFLENSSENNGIHLFIRKKTGMESIMLVETTKDPEGKSDNYAYRAQSWNPVNGNEIRYLDGKELKSNYGKYSLISSTPVEHEKLGQCFHIFIPQTVEYGYPWTRHGVLKIGKGTFINIRAFEKKYCDYSGAFVDNPFMFDFISRKKTEDNEKFTLLADYNPVAASKFEELSNMGNGLLTYSKGTETISEDLIASFEKLNSEQKIDVVFAIDTTGSMKDDLETLRTKWISEFSVKLKDFSDYRLGLLLYRDYNDNYLYKGLPVKYFSFTNNIEQFAKCLDSVIIKGNEGGDVPEAVYEALYASLQFYDWRKDAVKKIILIGDAEPHSTPRGPKKISQKTIIDLAKEKDVTLDCIIVPDKKD